MENIKNFPGEVSHQCNQIRLEISKQFDGNDLYGIYRLCPLKSRLTPNDFLYYNSQYTMRNTIIKGIKKIFIKNNLDNNLQNSKLYEQEDGLWPFMMCGDDLTVDTFLNSNSTKTQLNVYDKSQNWTQCAPLNYEWSDSIHLYNSTLLKYPNVKKWLISGTEDGVIATLGTMRWIHKIGFSVNKTWTQWKAEKQVSGYVQTYNEGLVLVTIKGAGHMEPQDKRFESKFVLDSFLKGVLPSEFKINEYNE